MNETSNMNETEEQKEDNEDAASASGDSSKDELYDGDSSGFEHDEESELEALHAPLTEAETEELIAELLEVESKAAEAQESLEKESLAQVESEVRAELAENLHGDELEKAVTTEMRTYIDEWETTLDELETESAHLLEQLDGSGIDLPSLYKWIESQAPDGCSTEAWRKRTHWVGSQLTNEMTESLIDAEKHLQSQRPVRRKHGKLLEEGASGFLGQKLSEEVDKEAVGESTEKDWSSFNKVVQSHRISKDETSFGGKHWASVYLASTPQQAANLGLQLPGVDEVEEINDIDGDSNDPFYADAVANEKEIDLSEEQRKNFKKVKEEDDANIARQLQLQLKRRRHRFRCKQDAIRQEIDGIDLVVESKINGSILSNESQALSNDKICSASEEVVNPDDGSASQTLKIEVPGRAETFNEVDGYMPVSNGTPSVVPGLKKSDSTEQRGEKRLYDDEGLEVENKRSRTVIIDSDDEVEVMEDKCNAHVSTQVTEDVSNLNADSLPLPCSNEAVVSENYKCTACAKFVAASEVHRHPLLKVIVCESCKCVIEKKMHEKDPDCSMCYCGWCGRCHDLISCKSCKILFCGTCIKGNFGEKRLSECQASGWSCFCCSPDLLQQLTVECEKALSAACHSVSSSDSDSGLSDTNVNATTRVKRMQKKKIRRILDDAELGEETKRKIAIEKARQEHLKSLKVQFNAQSWMMKPESCVGSTSEGANRDVLGDVTNGYIVNVVREKDEEAVRIPPSISSKLKPHQIKGIRFMWENIIQSIRKVRSGDIGLGCILAHTMGLGKTFQVIAFLYTALRSVDLGLKTALIVTPVNVLHNWRQEFIKWKPVELKALRVYMLEDVSRERRADLLAKWRSKGGVFLIGYNSFRNLTIGKNVKDRNMAREICCALQDGPDILVCDEAHIIKNTRADTTLQLKQVKCQRRIALTGSPLQNNLMEYYCMVDFVREGFLGSSHEFKNRFQNPIENGQHTNSTSYDVKVMNQRSHILYEQLKGFVQRMDMNVVKKDLPPKTVFVIAVKLSQLQRKLYKRFLDVHGFTSEKISSEKTIVRRSFFAGYQALAQIWNHPGLLQMVKEQKDYHSRDDSVENFIVDGSSSDDNVDTDILTGEKQKTKSDYISKKNDNGFICEDWWMNLLNEKNYKDVEYSGKMVVLLDILSMASAVGDKALVFSQSLTTLDLIEHYLSKLPQQGKRGKYWKQGKDWYRLDGSTEGSERQKIVERFNEPMNSRVKCTLISTRAGSLGINLYAANRVIIVDGSWNPTHDLQAIYRAWRYGQKKPVYAYRLMAQGTMEEKIYKRQVTKEGLAARVVDKQQIHRTMSKEEMLHLFDFGDEENSDAMLEEGLENRFPTNECRPSQATCLLKQNVPHGSCSSDKLMETLLSKHSPRWIATYHEHETLLQENEEEKLTKEEQDMAWEMYRRTVEWKEVQRVAPIDEPTNEWKPPVAPSVPEEPTIDRKPPVVPTVLEEFIPRKSKARTRNRCLQRKCTNLSHLLTLRSQGIKTGVSTVCGECAHEISWENLNRVGENSGR